MLQKAILIGIKCVLGILPLGGVIAQDIHGSRVQLNETRVTKLFSMKVVVLAVDRDLVVPFCGESEGGARTLCNLPTRLEVKMSQGWNVVELKHSHRILGGVPVKNWKAQLVRESQGHEFIFMLPMDEFNMESGQELRLIIDTWPDEESMRSGKQPIKLITPEVKCP